MAEEWQSFPGWEGAPFSSGRSLQVVASSDLPGSMLQFASLCRHWRCPRNSVDGNMTSGVEIVQHHLVLLLPAITILRWVQKCSLDSPTCTSPCIFPLCSVPECSIYISMYPCSTDVLSRTTTNVAACKSLFEASQNVTTGHRRCKAASPGCQRGAQQRPHQGI